MLSQMAQDEFAENGFKVELSMESQIGGGSPYILSQMAQDEFAENWLKEEVNMESQIGGGSQ